MHSKDGVRIVYARRASFQMHNGGCVIRVYGMVNQLAKFIPELASINEPLRQLLRKGNQFLWGQPQERAFQEIKQKLTSPDVLAHDDPSKRSVAAVDTC